MQLYCTEGWGVTQKVARIMPCSTLVAREENILETRPKSAIESIRSHLQEGELLIRQGLPLESLVEYEQCLMEQPTHAPAWDGMAAAYESLGDLNKADRCSEAAEQIRRMI